MAALQRNAETDTIPIVVITAREVTAADHATLTQGRGQIVHVIDKADFNRGNFIAELKRALLAIGRS